MTGAGRREFMKAGAAMRLRAETRGVRRPVRWACAQPVNADGSLDVRLLAADDPKWRKGI